PFVLAAIFVSAAAFSACDGGDGDGTGGSSNDGGGGAGGTSTTTTTTTSDTTTTSTTSTTTTSTGSACEEGAADCDACEACAFSTGGCSDEWDTCVANTMCGQLYGCAEDCKNSCAGSPDAGCVDECINGPGGCSDVYPDGATDYQAVVQCVLTQECPTICTPN
ncbi:MAG TPA: hypothetical protein VLS89_14755, partial [Candidatus Nanopelagicales bacterium]|nr:hypothetical protein [Candidatus Nanopelagicales bacterium]